MKFIIENSKVYIHSNMTAKMTRYNWHNGYLYSIIKRYKEKRRAKNKIQGDNCPMLYAMKQSDGLIVESETVEQLYAYAKVAIKECFKDNFPFDVIITMPSSHNICDRLANIISELYSVPIITDYLVKNSRQVAINTVKMNKNIDSNIKQQIKTALERDKIKLTIKWVKAEYRKYVPILAGRSLKLPSNTRSVLLIDDIYSSGATLNNAMALIYKHSPKIENISALTLFGPLRTLK